eukprot:TRINITY_DN22780_c0_g1_i1.p1 TRINITY_DN22780_c0_g1~~TRINITY_DN22780_c0_g1_i1.p1  ORF type:complete len:115 (+),score=17.64 TRINITY_DN22780_c0_g1_i1:28-345(+)
MRRDIPTLNHVWLSSRMQLDIDEAKQFNDWNFLFSEHNRQQGPQPVVEYEKQIGLEQFVSNSFANLLISAESDYFVGALDSVWSRVIDGLRSTNGRIFSGFIAVE